MLGHTNTLLHPNSFLEEEVGTNSTRLRVKSKRVIPKCKTNKFIVIESPIKLKYPIPKSRTFAIF